MKLRTSLTLPFGLTILMMAASATAHHSFAGEFDASHALHLHGMVAGVQMLSPHSYIYLEVPTAEGGVERWALESPSTLNIRRRGLEQVVKAGDPLSVCGYAARRDVTRGWWTTPATGGSARRLSAAVLTLSTGEKHLWENYRQGQCVLDR